MDVTFDCPHCKQQLTADKSLAGTQINCPTCGQLIAIPAASFHVINPIASSAAAKEEKHFSVPLHEGPSEILVSKPSHTDDLVSHDGAKKLRIKTIRRIDCVEVGHDRFDQKVTEVLAKIGEENIVSINTISYTHIDIGSQKLLTDFGIIIVYKG
jgi:hypothetical protein